MASRHGSLTTVSPHPSYLASSTRTMSRLLSTCGSITGTKIVAWQRASYPRPNCYQSLAAKRATVQPNNCPLAPSFRVLVQASTFMRLLHPKTASWFSAIAQKTAKVTPGRMCYVSAILSPVKCFIFLAFDTYHHTTMLCLSLMISALMGTWSNSSVWSPFWIKGKKFIYRYYCSKTRSWWRPASAPNLMASLYLIPSPPVASHGAIHWLCGSWKTWALSHVVTLHVDGEELSYLELPSEAKRKKAALPLLANSADGSLLLLLMTDLRMSLWKHKGKAGDGTSNWVRSETIDMTIFLPTRLPKMDAGTKVKLEIFRGKSGVAVLWIEGEGLFMFSLGDRSMRKIDNERVTEMYRFCPCEIDWLSCLAVTNLVVNDSLSLDAEREKAQRRWRRLVAKNIQRSTP